MGRLMRVFLGVILGLWCLAATAAAQELSALARFDPAASHLRQDGEGLDLSLSISQPVPWRVRHRSDPPRLILDLREVDWTGIDRLALPEGRVASVRAGVFRPGWSRLVLELTAPMVVTSAAMETEDGTRIALRLDPASEEEFARRAAQPDPPGWALPDPADLPLPPARGEGPLVVVLDPGHGGLDPGAEAEGYKEADLMLTFAREFKEALLREGGYIVVLTREEDVFVPLETRISIARAAGADLFLSLHADALAEGEAVGATLYTLSDAASERAAETLAERHDRDDLLAGVDLTEADDLVASVLMDMARTETAPKVDRLALTLRDAIKAEGLRMHRRPIQSGGFSVLKSPDIPSLLVEIGFMSSARDLARLTDPDWRARMARALVAGIGTWAAAEAALRGTASSP